VTLRRSVRGRVTGVEMTLEGTDMAVSDPRGYRAGTGWLTFAAVMLLLSGIFKIFDALWAFKYDDEVSQEVQTIVFEGDLQTYGWVWLVIGVLLVAAGLSVLSGAEWARWVGIIAASIAALTYMPWIYFQPFWALVSIFMAVSVIYGLAVYGGRDPI
jgi:hypothetical protein